MGANRQNAIQVCKVAAFALEKLAPATADSLREAAEILEADGERCAEIARLVSGESKAQISSRQSVCTCYLAEIQRCSGTKEVDLCNCGGDRSKCDFYPEKRGWDKSAKS